ncbi:dihydrolipoyl dehydrogenase family protein [Haloferax larsenii]|uniref:Dihydrolipoamide dehydrogenase n=1 Tax=Haloferax larsenii TaxID=302484 RepID=A0A1H7QWP6_HALLR|nr:dihydrolipoyl dehydrogenase [Haloferax larsenii]SEL52055.1 dihydrolipoamide dehydrogenase [Haloferax larsenii]
MADFDLVVIGGGTGNTVASNAAAEGLETALVEPGPLGGTCLNRGCNPSKMLIQHATRLNQIRDAARFRIESSVESVDVPGIVDDVFGTLDPIAERMASQKVEQANLTLFEHEARFVGDHTVEIGGREYTADQILIAAGSRPLVPGAIDGLRETDSLTSAEALRLRNLPDRLVILGGGYIAAELGYYFQSLGTDVALVEMMDTLLPREDEDVAAAFTDIAEARHEVYTGFRATSVSSDGEAVTVHAENESGETVAVSGDDLLVALGRRPNTDRLNLDATGIELDERGFVRTTDRLETSVEGVWASGDIAGNAMFKHSADYEVEVVTDNIVHGKAREANFDGLTHAVFTDPQVAGVGTTEQELREDGTDYVVGRAAFTDTAMSRALKLEDGFVKVLASPSDGEVLGVHAIGHEASMLIHEATIAVRHGLSVHQLADTIHVHPALNKVMAKAFSDASERVAHE